MLLSDIGRFRAAQPAIIRQPNIRFLNRTTNGHDNVACGTNAMQNNSIGYSNVAIGSVALQSNTSGSSNIAIGTLAGYYLTARSNNIDIGNQGTAGESGIIRIGSAGTHFAKLERQTTDPMVSGAT